MRRNFLELRSFLESRNSDLIGFIDGENYPPPLSSQYIASATSLLFFGGLVLLMLGDQIFANLGIPEPDFYVYMKNNKMTSFGALFVLNNLGNSMLTTGAFEIFVNGDLVFSKLQTGRFPNGDELVEIMNRFNIKL
mmetsp:Transcript_1771/g.2781  ORF Transcript_1771/g.2781 Transcript_1771/m.2781 type:complete len:136 (+) Transcript_1771:373-780(+)